MIGDNGLNTLSVADLLLGFAQQRFKPRDVLHSCLARIAEREPDVRAWVEPPLATAYLDYRPASLGEGALFGVPFGVKDVIDAQGFDTRMGSKIYEDFRPQVDAGCVAQLRLAGAIAIGKTATCEFAGIEPTKTRNPRDLNRTPGGSSSGSAAAVADFMVPFALGTQTGGSILRPASFCGVVGFKPTFGSYSVSGVKAAAHSFDTVGLFTRSASDALICHRVLMNSKDRTAERFASPIRIGLFKSHVWNEVSAAAAEVYTDACQILADAGATLHDVDVATDFSAIASKRAAINAYERYRSLAGEARTGMTALSSSARDVIERGRDISGEEYEASRQAVEQFRNNVESLFQDLDFLLTPAATGEAPILGTGTGDPRVQEVWTMLHCPSISIPAFEGANGMPIGVQLVGRRFSDTRLLLAASWAQDAMEKAGRH